MHNVGLIKFVQKHPKDLGEDLSVHTPTKSNGLEPFGESKEDEKERQMTVDWYSWCKK